MPKGCVARALIPGSARAPAFVCGAHARSFPRPARAPAVCPCSGPWAAAAHSWPALRPVRCQGEKQGLLQQVRAGAAGKSAHSGAGTSRPTFSALGQAITPAPRGSGLRTGTASRRGLSQATCVQTAGLRLLSLRRAGPGVYHFPYTKAGGLLGWRGGGWGCWRGVGWALLILPGSDTLPRRPCP